jgi:hypothetical protein
MGLTESNRARSSSVPECPRIKRALDGKVSTFGATDSHREKGRDSAGSAKKGHADVEALNRGAAPRHSDGSRVRL